MSISAARLLLGHSFIRVSHVTLRKFTAFSFPSSIRLTRYATSSIAIDSTQSDASVQSLHPWPEWVTLVDRWREKGYFGGLKEDSSDETAIYTDKNVIKEASLIFARHRFDIIRSLSRDDIQNVVGKGCPNLLRKVVNSAKRLRAYLELEEGDVCSSCNLRDSCDRAYVVLDDSDTTARTVDVVRLLIAYALDSSFISQETKSPQTELIESSARELLSQLIKLDETPLDPDIPLPAPVVKRKPSNGDISNGRSVIVVKNGEWACASCKVQNSSKDFKCKSCGWDVLNVNKGGDEMREGDWICLRCRSLNFAGKISCFSCKMKVPKLISANKGDWNCAQCNYLNFARNVRCFKCKTDGPERVNFGEVEMKKGDWNCPQCSFMNFAANRNCFRCHEARPPRQLRPGDWECPSCDALNFSSKTVCFRCNEPAPPRLLRPGDWECSSCNFLNFGRNTICKRCNLDRPLDSEDKQRTWKKPSTQFALE